MRWNRKMSSLHNSQLWLWNLKNAKGKNSVFSAQCVHHTQICTGSTLHRPSICGGRLQSSLLLVLKLKWLFLNCSTGSQIQLNYFPAKRPLTLKLLLYFHERLITFQSLYFLTYNEMKILFFCEKRQNENYKRPVFTQQEAAGCVLPFWIRIRNWAQTQRWHRVIWIKNAHLVNKATFFVASRFASTQCSSWTPVFPAGPHHANGKVVYTNSKYSRVTIE